MIERAAWGAAAASGESTSHEIERITVHHAAVVFSSDGEAPARIRRYQRFHQDSGFADLAYHFVVDRRGNVYEGRALGIAGETFTEYDPNGHFLPMADGDFNKQEISEAQLASLAKLIAWGTAAYSLDTAATKGHRDWAPTTSCPGTALYAHLTDGSLHTMVQDSLATGVQLVYLRGQPALDRVAAIEAS